MHIADGVLSMPVTGATVAGAAAAVAWSVKGIREEEIPKTSLLAGAFFAVSLISIPVGPSSIHPLFAGLSGIILGRRAPLALFVALLLQAALFQHGGLTALGANTLMLALPALLAHYLYHRWSGWRPYLKGALIGGGAVMTTVALLVLLLLATDPLFGEGFYSVVSILVLGHLPLAGIEAGVTGSAVQLIARARPELLVRKAAAEKL